MKYKYLFLSILISASLFSQDLKRAVEPKSMLSELPSYFNTRYIIIKIKESERSGSSDYFPDKDESLLQAIQKVVFGKEFHLEPLIILSKEFLLSLKRRGEERSGITLGNLSLYYRIDLNNFSETEKIAIHNALMSMSELETVYFPLNYRPGGDVLHPKGAETPQLTSTPDFSAKQFYLNPAPAGLDAKYAWTKPGGDGAGIKFCDVELGLNKTHEDLVHDTITDISVFPSTTDDHGTAVHGVVYAKHNGFGVDGMAWKVKPYFSNAYDSTGSFDIANSMARAIPYLNPGDVMLLEMMDQSGDPNSTYAPVEFSQAEFDVIQNITASGIIVIEAAGNGNKNLDDQTKYGHKFDSTFRYSGAFMIGGIQSGTSTGGTNPAHQRRSPSSYGSRVDFHSYSEMVTTLGYGDLYGAISNEKYTSKFFGTSSASPIIAGAAILMESIYKNASAGQTLDHKALKSLLRYGATLSYAPATDKIGVMPDLKKAIDQMLLALSAEHLHTIPASFVVYPTLADDALLLFDANNSSEKISYSICDLSGKRVLENDLYLVSSGNRIDVSGLSSGMYFLRIDGSKRSGILKFVKK